MQKTVDVDGFTQVFQGMQVKILNLAFRRQIQHAQRLGAEQDLASPASREQAVGAVNVGGVTFRTGRAIFSRVNGDAHFERADFIPDRALGMLLQRECKLQRLAAFEKQDGMIPVYLGDLTGMPPGTPSQVPPFGIEASAPPQPTLVRVAIAQQKASDAAPEGSGKAAPQTIDTYLPVSFTRGVLLGGLDAPTGGQSQTNPHPILIRLSDNSVLPNRFRAEYRECFVIAAGYGDISSERAYLRTESLSCVRADGTALEVRIQGSVYGEDGKVGMRGRLVTKQGQMLANALMAGVVSGIGQGISTANTTYSTSALGQVATTGGSDALRAGLGSGVGKALDRLAQYYIKLAEQTFPVIEVDAGREIDVVITKGVRIEGVDTAKASPTSYRRRADPAERYMKVNDDED